MIAGASAPAYFLLRYNLPVRNTRLIPLIVLLVSLLFLLTTINPVLVDQFEVPFSTRSGVSGQLAVSLPTRVFAGDRGKIQVLYDQDDGGEFSPVTLAVRVEAGFEEISPGGVINVGIRNPEPVSVEWIFRASKAAEYPGTLWIWIDAGEGQELLLAKDIRVESSLYLGAKIAIIRIFYGFVGVSAFAWLLVVILRKSK